MADWVITSVQGGTISRTLTFTDDAGLPIDTTGWQWRSALIGRNVNESPTIVSPVSGTVAVTVPKEITRRIPVGTYQLVVDWTDAQGSTPEQEIVGIVTIRGQGAV